MTEAIVVAVITGLFALLGTYLTVNSGNKEIMAQMKTSQAVQATEIAQLKEEIGEIKSEMTQLRTEVRKHNDFAVRVPLIEDTLRRMSNIPR